MNRVVAAVGVSLLLSTGFAYAQRQPAPQGPKNPFIDNPVAEHDGDQLYNQNCTACHGAKGTAGEIGPAIVKSQTSNLRGTKTDSQIVAIIRNGVPDSAMPAWKGKLLDNDILKIGAYIHSLRGTAINSPTPGNVKLGEEIFFGKKGGCSTCHMINGRGGLIGPDLTNIAGTRKVENIKAALTEADHRIWTDGGDHLKTLPPMDTYDHVLITLKNGKTLDGVLLNQDGYSVQLMGMDNQLHLLDRTQIASVKAEAPLMPTDYDKRLTKEEFTNLMAFLTRQGRGGAAQTITTVAGPD
jgi:putative heme-binding domain-containing protein